MGSGWEQHIARLIDQAHETLSSSAYSRRHRQSSSAPSPYGSLSSPYRGGSTTPLRSASTTFRGDRGASYRRGSEGWDESSFVKESSGGGGGCPSPLMAPPPPPFSRLAGARVHDARIDGLEDRVKLEVQTVVRRDVSTLVYFVLYSIRSTAVRRVEVDPWCAILSLRIWYLVRTCCCCITSTYIRLLTLRK